MYKQAKSDFEIEKLKAAQWDKQARMDEPTLKSRYLITSTVPKLR